MTTTLTIDLFGRNMWIDGTTKFPTPMVSGYVRLARGQSLASDPTGMTLTFAPAGKMLVDTGDTEKWLTQFSTPVQYHARAVDPSDSNTYDYLGIDSNVFDSAFGTTPSTSFQGVVIYDDTLKSSSSISLSAPPQAKGGDSFTIYSYDNAASAFVSEYSVVPSGTKAVVQLNSSTSKTGFAGTLSGSFWVLPSLQQDLVGTTVQLTGQTTLGSFNGSAKILGIWCTNADGQWTKNNEFNVCTAPYTAVALDQDILSKSTGGSLVPVTGGTLTLNSSSPNPSPSSTSSTSTSSKKWLIVGGVIGGIVLLLVILILILMHHKSSTPT